MTPARLERRVLGLCGVWLLGLGLYFVFVRPPMLPEDLRFIGTSPEALAQAVPGLPIWLQRVFTVMGGFIFGGGALTLCLLGHLTERRVRIGLWFAGASTVGLMSAVNFAIASDFKWLLLAPALAWLWVLCIAEVRQRKNSHMLRDIRHGH